MQKNKYETPKLIVGAAFAVNFLICFFLFNTKSIPKKVPLKSVQTHFVTLAPQKKAIKATTSTTKKKLNTPASPPSKKVKKPETKKSTLVLLKEEKNKIVPLPKQDLPKKSPKNELVLPTLVGKLELENPAKNDLVLPNLPVTSIGYVDQVKMFLASKIFMPHKGEVLVEVKVNQSGKILSISVKKASDQEIFHVIKSQIAKIDLPPLSHEYLGEKEHTFTFNFI
ncbi:MAG: hypothetical protein S4CHLAM7_10550 [Chlamydiae bacterium]|nr:hypothetical protein [Chlamydiota bacterium]